MKILLVTNMYPSKKYPHYGIFVKNTEKVLIDAGHKVINVHLCKHDNSFFKFISYFIFYIKAFIFYFIYNIDAVYVHYASHSSLPIILAEKLKNRKLVVNVHGNDLVPETENDYKYLKFTKTVLKISDVIICPSKYFQNVLIEDYRISKDKIAIYPSGGVDTDLFKKIDKRIACEKLNLPNNYDYIGYVGRIEHGKGWDLFLNICARIIENNKNIRLVVVGSGSEDKLYAERVSELGLDKYIYKYDLLNHDELKYIYNSLLLLLVVTSRKSESLCLVGLESMACETVTILPNKYGPSSYGIDGYNSYVFKTENEESLYDAILKSLNNDNSVLTKNARETSLKYDKRKYDTLLKVFK